MAKNSRKKSVLVDPNPDESLEVRNERAIRMYLVDAETKISAGTAKPALMHSLISLRRQLQASFDLTPATVVAWFRRLNPTERARFVRELQTIDSKRSGLA